MAFGILETKDPNAPGTENVYERDNILQELSSKLKRDGDTILVPQPTDDPNDPLNWPLWKKDCILGVLCLMSLIASTLSPLLAANTVTISIYFQTTFTNTALLTGYHLLAVGASGFIFVASARILGKRHLYLLGSIFIIASSAWGGFATPNSTPEESNRSFAWLIAVRVIQGVGLAPFEGLVNASVADMYFVHQRGLRMAASNMSLFGGAFFTPIIVGKITHTLHWWWTFWLIAIFSAAIFPLIVFYCPETTYSRPDYKTLEGDLRRLREHYDSQRFDAETEKLTPPPAAYTTTGAPSPPGSSSSLNRGARADEPGVVPQKDSYLTSLLPFNRIYSYESPWKLLLRPFPLFLHPAILWACLIQGAMIGWTVMIGVVLAAIFLGPPLLFDEVKTGYQYAGPFLGAVFGFILTGLFTDLTTKWLVKKNHGIYEPEFRLLLVIPQLIFGAVGLYGFGWAALNVTKGQEAIPAIFFALEVVGMLMGAVASSLYIVDAYREYQVEAFTCLLIFKNILSFGLTWSAYNWLITAGTRTIFIALGSVQIGICLLTIPLWIFGKRQRAFWHKHDYLKMFGLR